MRRIITIITVLTSSIFVACFSTPHIENAVRADANVSYDSELRSQTFWNLIEKDPDKRWYRVKIDPDYEARRHFNYAINQFVKEEGGQSFDVYKIDSYRGDNGYGWLVCIPGEQMVVNYSEVPLYLHKGRTTAVIIVSTAAVLAATLLIGPAVSGE